MAELSPVGYLWNVRVINFQSYLFNLFNLLAAGMCAKETHIPDQLVQYNLVCKILTSLGE